MRIKISAVRLWLALALVLTLAWTAPRGYPAGAQDEASVVAVMTGDSIEAGHGSKHSAYFDPGGEGGDISAEIGYQMRLKLGKAFTYKDYAKGGSTWQWVATQPVGMIFAANAKEIWVHCGINDVYQKRKWDDVKADMDTFYAATTGPIFVDEVLPVTEVVDSQAAVIRALNQHYASWAKDKPRVRIVKCWAEFGKLRKETKHLDDLQKKYDSGDLLHINAAGAAKLAAIRVKVRAEYYASQAAAKPPSALRP